MASQRVIYEKNPLMATQYAHENNKLVPYR